MNLGTLTQRASQIFSAAFSKGQENKPVTRIDGRFLDLSDFQGPYPDRRRGCRGEHRRTDQQQIL